MSTYLWVAFGGALGSVMRFWMTNVVATITGPRFPWGTILINIVGSFVIGLIAYIATPIGRVPMSLDIRAFILAGICGGFTTFSAFSLQTFELAREGRWLAATTNIVLSVILCVLAAWAGYAVASTTYARPGT